MPRYQLKVYGTGLLINARKISSEQANFWSQKNTTDLTDYVFNGDNSFDNFLVPKNAKFTGIYAEDEENLKVGWSHECPVSNNEINQIYGPKIDVISRVELLDTKTSGKIIWAKDNPQFDDYLVPNDPDQESINVYLDIADNNLLMFESEKGCWIYECESDKEIESIDHIKVITSNSSFGGDIDSIVDNVCVAFVAFDKLFTLFDSETENKGAFATIYID
jgi:hypothetical protein